MKRYRNRRLGRWSASIIPWVLAACGDEAPAPRPDAGVAADVGTPEGGIRLEVSDVFAPGTALIDAYTGAAVTVADDGAVRIEPGLEGVVLLERADAPPAPPFTWDNATVYFVVTDRFENGDPGNDQSYGRDFSGMPTVGTFHGGDLAGLTQRLDHLEALGVTALWITPPVEQVHGFVAGGASNSGFPHYGYAGYWALDFTRLDANMGTEAELRALVDGAHARGIRVIFDVVMNHPGYATFPEIERAIPDALALPDASSWRPEPDGSWYDMYDFIDYTNPGWTGWWSPDWIRAGLPGHVTGTGDLEGGQSFLPDFKTESTAAVGLPPILAGKADTGAETIPGATVRDYLVAWHTRWVREFGIDGFRCDTAKHVELGAWAELKDAAVAALRAWKADNPDKALDELDFWMTGEVFPHGVTKDQYYTQGKFDSLINFDFQSRARSMARDPAMLDGLYAEYAGAINDDPEFNVLTYISSHDTSLFFGSTDGDVALQRAVGTALLLMPGGVQIFYGDESGRVPVDGMGDATAGTRSDMNWDSMNEGLLSHWQKVGRFRKRHPAVGAGAHQTLRLDDEAWVFGRTAGDDAVVVAILPSGG